MLLQVYQMTMGRLQISSWIIVFNSRELHYRYTPENTKYDDDYNNNNNNNSQSLACLLHVYNILFTMNCEGPLHNRGYFLAVS